MKKLLQELIDRQELIYQTELDSTMDTEDYDNEIDDLNAQLAGMKARRDEIRKPYDDSIKLLEDNQYETKMRILEAWDGEKKTLNFERGTLKFRTTTTLDIKNTPALLEDLLDRFSTFEEVMDHITGFNKTAVKKYIGVHKMPPGVVELIPKTSVSFTTE